jgi:hypothetical protein
MTNLQQEAAEALRMKHERQSNCPQPGAWKFLWAFHAEKVIPPIAPSALFDHFSAVTQRKTDGVLDDKIPLHLGPFGPLTDQDSELCSDITNEEVEKALKDTNLSSAPGSSVTSSQ